MRVSQAQSSKYLFNMETENLNSAALEGEATDTESINGLASEDEGDTTETLDDSDHLGLVRFGIEAIDEDDEDAEEALTYAILERNLIDARNMGLSISINALAEHPEAVITKTARTLGVIPEIAAKILTTVGMSILIDSGANAPTSRKKRKTRETEATQCTSQKLKEGHTLSTVPFAPAGVSGDAAATVNTKLPATADAKLDPAMSSARPIMGNFLPSGAADLCTVVSENGFLAPSPFSARRVRQRRSVSS